MGKAQVRKDRRVIRMGIEGSGTGSGAHSMHGDVGLTGSQSNWDTHRVCFLEVRCPQEFVRFTPFDRGRAEQGRIIETFRGATV